jgi:hypothetical protein
MADDDSLAQQFAAHRGHPRGVNVAQLVPQIVGMMVVFALALFLPADGALAWLLVRTAGRTASGRDGSPAGGARGASVAEGTGWLRYIREAGEIPTHSSRLVTIDAVQALAADRRKVPTAGGFERRNSNAMPSRRMSPRPNRLRATMASSTPRV